MSNTYTWKIFNLERTVEDHRVFRVHYTVTATSDQTNENGDPYKVRAGGEVDLEGDVSIPFADLTEPVVLGWVQETLGGDEKVSEIQAELDTVLSEVITPTKSSGLPW